MWGLRGSKQKKTERAPEPDGAETPSVFDEFAAGDELDNDVELDEANADAMQNALECLRGQHLAFRTPEKCEECDLDQLRLEILTTVTASPDLEDYYREAWQGAPAPAGNIAFPSSVSAHRRVAVMQLELMTRAFYVLQLQLFANAPENHGWMTMFRSWGRSARFNAVFNELASTLGREFVKFYETYIRYLPARASASGQLPIHHPWLAPEKAVGRGCFMDSGLMEVELRPGTGGVLDPRGSDAPDQPFETPSDAPESGGSSPAPKA